LLPWRLVAPWSRGRPWTATAWWCPVLCWRGSCSWPWHLRLTPHMQRMRAERLLPVERTAMSMSRLERRWTLSSPCMPVARLFERGGTLLAWGFAQFRRSLAQLARAQVRRSSACGGRHDVTNSTPRQVSENPTAAMPHGASSNAGRPTSRTSGTDQSDEDGSPAMDRNEGAVAVAVGGLCGEVRLCRIH